MHPDLDDSDVMNALDGPFGLYNCQLLSVECWVWNSAQVGPRHKESSPTSLFLGSTLS